MASETGSMGEPQYQEDIARMQALGLQRMGVHATWAFHDDPKRLLFTMSRYKFVAKMIEGAGHALEIGCSDGFFTRVVRQSVGAVTAIDFDPSFIASAKETVSERWPIDFRLHDLRTGPVEGPAGGFDAVYSLDVLEHIHAGAEEERFLANAIAPLSATGTCIIGMPSLQSQAYASAHSKAGHVNCKTLPDFKRLMQRYFTNVYMFSMNDEVVHTGYHAMAHYLIALCCGKREEVARDGGTVTVDHSGVTGDPEAASPEPDPYEAARSAYEEENFEHALAILSPHKDEGIENSAWAHFIGSVHFRALGEQAAIDYFDHVLSRNEHLPLFRSPGFRASQESAIARGVPPMLFVTMPKSGSVFLVNCLCEATGVENMHVSPIAMSEKPIPAALRTFAKGGALSQEHLKASDENLALLRDAGIGRVFLHLRDPRQAILSFYHHVYKNAGESNVLTGRERDERRKVYGDRLNIDHVIAFFETEFPSRIDWCLGWLTAHRTQDWLRIKFGSFEEMVVDSREYVSSILEFFDAPFQRDALPDFDQTKAERAAHFRNGRTDEWREVLPEAFQKDLWKRMPDDLVEFFGWAA